MLQSEIEQNKFYKKIIQFADDYSFQIFRQFSDSSNEEFNLVQRFFRYMKFIKKFNLYKDIINLRKLSTYL